MKAPESFYEFRSDHKGSVTVDLDGIREILAESKRRGLYIHSIEGSRVDSDGSTVLDVSLSKLGIRGEDKFATLEQHYEFDEKLVEYASNQNQECVFEVWLNDEQSLQKKNST